MISPRPVRAAWVSRAPTAIRTRRRASSRLRWRARILLAAVGAGCGRATTARAARQPRGRLLVRDSPATSRYSTALGRLFGTGRLGITATVGATVVGQIRLDTTQFILRLVDTVGLASIEYVLDVAPGAVDCCISRTLDVGSETTGTGTVPPTVDITPAGCGDGPPCSPDPSGSWTLTQLAGKSCQWAQFKAGVSAVLSLLYDAITGTFEWELVITGSDYTMVFVWISLPGQTTIDCSVAIPTALVFQDPCVCSVAPLGLTVTPIMSNSICCGTTCICADIIRDYATLYARFTGALSELGCVPILQGIGGGYATWEPASGVPSTSCSPPGNFGLSCDTTDGTTMRLLGMALLVGSPDPITGVTPTSCSPFSITFSGTVNRPLGACDGEAWSVTISSIPC